LAKAQAYREANPEVNVQSRLKVKYGITIEAHTAMLQLQFYKCAACGDKFDPENPMKRACVDHDHVTDKVRQLLCAQCNLLAQEDIERLEKVVAYVRSHSK
jgi:DNA-directed RNA polymerase subunit RPC12/RpoP